MIHEEESMSSYDEMMNYVEEENIKFIRLTFFDIRGVQKNVAIMPDELERAFHEGVPFDASSVQGYGEESKSDLFLVPDSTTMTVVPWRPVDGRVARMFCDIQYPDGREFEKNPRYILKQAVRQAEDAGIHVNIGAEVEFYIFRRDDEGRKTMIPQDHAGYMDIAPMDHGENIRRDISFALLDMGIHPEASHHEMGPGQNEVDFRYSDPLTAADNTATFKWVVKSIANADGMWADFSPKPLPEEPGSGMHINMSVISDDGKDYLKPFMAGILEHIREITCFLNPVKESYSRLGEMKAPGYVSWSEQNRSQLVRIPATHSGIQRIELRSPDPSADPYLSYALLILAGLDGIKRNLQPEAPLDVNLNTVDPSVRERLKHLPQSLPEALQYARESQFLKGILPDDFIDSLSET